MSHFRKITLADITKLQLDAGMMLDDFTPSTRTMGNVIGLTTGGFSFNSNPKFVNLGEDIDMAPDNAWQFEQVVSYDPTMSGTFVSIDAPLAMTLNGASVFGQTTTVVVPTHQLTKSDFKDFWVVAPYGHDNSNAANEGFAAIHMMNALNTAGFQWQTNREGKGQFAFEFHAFYDATDLSVVPFEIYIDEGSPDLAPLAVTSEAGASSGKSKITVSGYTLGSGESYVYQTATTTAPSVDYGDSVTGWTALTNGNEITPTVSHTKITVAVKDSNGKAIAAGSATLMIAS